MDSESAEERSEEMNQLMRFEDLREWLLSKLSDSVETGGDDELILGFVRKLDAAPSATAATDRPDWAQQLPGAELYDRALKRRPDAQQPSHTTSHRTQEE